MDKVLGWLLLFLSCSVSAETLECTQYGYTDKGEDFHNMTLLPLTSQFTLKEQQVVFNKEKFLAVDPRTVGLDSKVLTYLHKKSGKVLYLYTNDQGAKEVGISKLNKDSDDVFADKSLFADCSVNQNKPSGVVFAVEVRSVNSTLPVFSF